MYLRTCRFDLESGTTIPFRQNPGRCVIPACEQIDHELLVVCASSPVNPPGGGDLWVERWNQTRGGPHSTSLLWSGVSFYFCESGPVVLSGPPSDVKPIWRRRGGFATRTPSLKPCFRQPESRCAGMVLPFRPFCRQRVWRKAKGRLKTCPYECLLHRCHFWSAYRAQPDGLDWMRLNPGPASILRCSPPLRDQNLDRTTVLGPRETKSIKLRDDSHSEIRSVFWRSYRFPARVGRR